MKNTDRELCVRAAWFYYKLGMTQEEVARHLGLNRIRIGKLLADAKRQGIVSFSIHSPLTDCLELEDQLRERWNLREVYVAPQVNHDQINMNLGAAGAQYLAMRHDLKDALIGVDWGNTVSYFLENLPLDIMQQVSMVTLCGGLNLFLEFSYSADRSPLYRLAKRFHIIPAPQFVSSAKTCRLILKEPEVEKILKLGEMTSVAMVGIGSTKGASTMVAAGTLTYRDLEILRNQGAVGDILGQFFDKDGNILDAEHHQRLIAIPLEKFKSMKNVVALAGGDHKVEAIRGALQGGYLHTLITDEATARKLLEAPA